MKSILLILIILFLWFVLNRWILPKFGIETWMSRTCSLDERPTIQETNKPKNIDWIEDSQFSIEAKKRGQPSVTTLPSPWDDEIS